MANHYDVPSWAGKPPVGTHLDVMKEDKLVQKLMLDEKKCYLFGRNPQMNDFCIDHQSCSRVHAAFVYHRNLHRAFLVDLGSTHGTYIGSLRLEPNRPTQLAPDSSFHFGASTRYYVMRQRPQPPARNIIDQLEKDKTEGGAAMLGLPETETELDLFDVVSSFTGECFEALHVRFRTNPLTTEDDYVEMHTVHCAECGRRQNYNLTEFNTAHNRRISMLGIGEDGESGGGGGVGGGGSGPGGGAPAGGRRKRRGVTFNEEEEVINPEDVDPSIGKFRNMVHSTVIPSKRARPDGIGPTSGLTNVDEGRVMGAVGVGATSHPMKHLHPASVAHQLYGDLPGSEYVGHVATNPILSSALATRLGISLPNPAPDVEMTPAQERNTQAAQAAQAAQAQLEAAHLAALAQQQGPPSLPQQAPLPPEPRKKKYAKEAWPGKKTTPALLV